MSGNEKKGLPYAPTIEVKSFSGDSRSDQDVNRILIDSDENGSVSVKPLDRVIVDPEQTLTGKILQAIEDERSIEVVMDERPLELTEKMVIPDSPPKDEPTQQSTPSAKSSYLPKDARIDIHMITDDAGLTSGIERLCKRYSINVARQGEEQVFQGRSARVPVVFKFAGYSQGEDYIYSLILEDQRTSLTLTLMYDEEPNVSLMFNRELMAKADFHKALRHGLPAANDKENSGIRSIMMGMLSAIPSAVGVGDRGYMRCQKNIKDSSLDYVPEAFANTIKIVNEFYHKKDLTEF